MAAADMSFGSFAALMARAASRPVPHSFASLLFVRAVTASRRIII
jgi:hypothetical protein